MPLRHSSCSHPPQRTRLDYFPRPPRRSPSVAPSAPPPRTQPPRTQPPRVQPPRTQPPPQPPQLNQQTIPDATNQDPRSPIHWGDPLVLPIEEETTTRFYYQNVNGLKLRDAGSDIKLSSHHLWERKASVIGFSETNVEWKQSWATNLVFQIFRRQWNHLKWCHSTSETKFESAYKPGGTCSLVTGSLATRVISEGSDPHNLGRWSYITITGRSRTITIITAYCPPVHSIETAGPLTNYFQQYHQLRQSGVTSPDPRQRFFTDLTATAHAFIHKRHELVIMLDSNDDLSDSSPTHSLTTECGLFSVHEQADYAADSPAPTTYARGRKRSTTYW